jgi:uncharacterized protein
VTTNAGELFEVIHSGERSRVKTLLDSDPALASAQDESGVSAILSSVYSGHPEIRDLLLSQGASLNLGEAAAVGRLDRVKEIVQENPALANSYSTDGFPVVALASFFGHFELARYLTERGADINAAATNGTGYNALTGAIAGGHTEVVKWLLESGADANYKYGPGYAPLLLAAANGHLGIVKLLLAHDADPLAITNDGKSPLKLAEERKHQGVGEFLRSI